MATITLNIPDAAMPRIRKGLCEYVGITDPAEQTGAAAKAALIQLVKNTVWAQDRLSAERELVVPPVEDEIT